MFLSIKLYRNGAGIRVRQACDSVGQVAESDPNFI